MIYSSLWPYTTTVPSDPSWYVHEAETPGSTGLASYVDAAGVTQYYRYRVGYIAKEWGGGTDAFGSQSSYYYNVWIPPEFTEAKPWNLILDWRNNLDIVATLSYLQGLIPSYTATATIYSAEYEAAQALYWSGDRSITLPLLYPPASTGIGRSSPGLEIPSGLHSYVTNYAQVGSRFTFEELKQMPVSGTLDIFGVYSPRTYVSMPYTNKVLGGTASNPKFYGDFTGYRTAPWPMRDSKKSTLAYLYDRMVKGVRARDLAQSNYTEAKAYYDAHLFSNGSATAPVVTTASTSTVTTDVSSRTGYITLAGVPQEGQRVTIDSSAAYYLTKGYNLDGSYNVGFEWQFSGPEIVSRQSFYEIPKGAAGRTLRVTVSYIDYTGSPPLAVSISTPAVTILAAPVVAPEVVVATDTSSISILGTPTVGSTVQLDYSLVTTLTGVDWALRKYAWYIGSTLLSTSQTGFQIPTTIAGSTAPVAGSSLTAKLSFMNAKAQKYSYTSPPVTIQSATTTSLPVATATSYGSVSILGDVKEGQTVLADLTYWTPGDRGTRPVVTNFIWRLDGVFAQQTSYYNVGSDNRLSIFTIPPYSTGKKLTITLYFSAAAGDILLTSVPVTVGVLPAGGTSFSGSVGIFWADPSHAAGTVIGGDATNLVMPVDPAAAWPGYQSLKWVASLNGVDTVIFSTTFELPLNAAGASLTVSRVVYGAGGVEIARITSAPATIQSVSTTLSGTLTLTGNLVPGGTVYFNVANLVVPAGYTTLMVWLSSLSGAITNHTASYTIPAGSSSMGQTIKLALAATSPGYPQQNIYSQLYTVGGGLSTHRYLTSSVLIKVTPGRGAQIAPTTIVDLSTPTTSPLTFARLDVHTLISGISVLLTGASALVRRDRHLVITVMSVVVSPSAVTRVGAKRRALVSTQGILVDPTAAPRFFRSTAPTPLVSSLYVTIYADVVLGRVVIGPPAPLVSATTVMVIPVPSGAFRDPGPRTYTAGTWVPENPRAVASAVSVVVSLITTANQYVISAPAPLVANAEIAVLADYAGTRYGITAPASLVVGADLTVSPAVVGVFSTPKLVFSPGVFAGVIVAPAAQFATSGMLDGMLVEQALPSLVFEVDDFLQYFFLEASIPPLFSLISMSEQVIQNVLIDVDAELSFAFDTLWTDPYSDGMTDVLPVLVADILAVSQTFWSIDLNGLTPSADIQGFSYDPNIYLDSDIPRFTSDILGSETFADYLDVDITSLEADIIMGMIEFITIEVTDDIVLGGEITFAGDFVSEGTIVAPEPDITFSESVYLSADIPVFAFDGDFIDPIELDTSLPALTSEILVHSFDADSVLPVLSVDILGGQEATFTLDATLQIIALEAIFADPMLIDGTIGPLVSDVVLSQSPFISVDSQISVVSGDVEWHTFTVDSIIVVPVTYGTKGNQYI